MCGIAAIISDTARSDLLFNMKNMTDVIRHRGPDDEGFLLCKFNTDEASSYGGNDTPEEVYRSSFSYNPSEKVQNNFNKEGHVVFGHRRLSIVDLTPAGHQPMSYANGRYWITYNGEIYNFPEIRSELVTKGYSFVSQSDTEVILAAYDYWGQDCLNRFNGMFAFVLLDLEKQEVFAARDRFGVKPLYYWISLEGYLAFASEIKQFTVLPGWLPQLNNNLAYDFLCRAVSDHSSETMFKGVYQLRGGEKYLLTIEELSKLDSTLKTEKWYVLKPKSFDGSFLEASEQYKSLLVDSVNLRLRSDVAVGSCLSGGLDSSSIVSIVSNILEEEKITGNQKTFSSCSDIERFDERYYADIVVEHSGANGSYTYPNADQLFEELDKLAWHQDEPFGSTSIFAQWKVFELASMNKVKVMLDGQGADEQLIGYHGFFKTYLKELLMSLKLIALVRETRAFNKVHGYKYLGNLQSLLKAAIPQSLKNHLRRSILKPDWLNLENGDLNLLNPEGNISLRNIQEESFASIIYYSLPMLLHWEDRDSMAHSVESRVPFVDYRLMEFALGLPAEYKISQGITKRVLREAMKGILPEPVRTRNDKMGFVTAEEVWLKELKTEAFREGVRNTIEVTDGLILPSAMDELEKVINGKKPFSFLPWRLISFGKWVELFKVRIG